MDYHRVNDLLPINIRDQLTFPNWVTQDIFERIDSNSV